MSDTYRDGPWTNAKSDEATERALYLQKKYAMAPEDFDELLDLQSGRCAICFTDVVRSKQIKNGKRIQAVVDHDHETNEVRGLLCSNCNTGLGLLGDNIRNLASAIVYLQEHEKRKAQNERD